MKSDEIRSWVRAHLATVLGLPAEEIDLERTLDHFGLDSVEAILMAGALEDELGLQIDPAVFLQYPTIEAMISGIEQQSRSPP